MKRVAALQTVNEENLRQTYPEVVRPWFEQARKSGTLKAPDGRALSWMAVESPEERGALVIVPGFTEVADSYGELLYDLRESGYSFYLLDHRGQGLSEGDYPTRERWYVEDWRSFLSDLELFYSEIVMAKKHRRAVLYGCSMGGAIATAFLAEHPGAADALVLVAPMFRINTSPVPLPLMDLATRSMTALGKGTSYLPGYGPYESSPFEGNSWRIASRARYEQGQRLELSNPLYQSGGPTAKGGLELLRLCRGALMAAARVTVPTLLLQAGKDRTVSNRAEDQAAGRMKNCRTLVLPESNHVIMLEPDEVRSMAVEAIDEFLTEIAGD